MATSSFLWMFSLLLKELIFEFYSQDEPRRDKTNQVSVRPAKTQISLGIRLVWSESSLCTQWVAKDPSFLHAGCEDSDQTGRMPRLIWVLAGHTITLLVLSRGGSDHLAWRGHVCRGQCDKNKNERKTEEEMGRQHQRIVRNGIWRFPEDSGIKEKVLTPESKVQLW